MSNTEIWRLANEMIRLYGEDAGIKAAMRADKLLELGDPKGFHTWKAVTQAIERLFDGDSNALKN